MARPVRGWLVSPTGRVNLFDGDNLLGRDLDDVIDVPSPTVLRRHATIGFDAEAWLEDLGSKNGTFVGDLRVTQPVRLADGDRVRLGAVLLTFKLHRTNGAASTQSRPALRTRRWAVVLVHISLACSGRLQADLGPAKAGHYIVVKGCSLAPRLLTEAFDKPALAPIPRRAYQGAGTAKAPGLRREKSRG